jgi:serine/threonine protein kinase
MRQALQPTEGPGLATSRSQAPSREAVAAAFPHLEVIDLIGQGGMGAVFRARQPNLGRLVALKVIPADAGGATDAFAERFEREGRLLARLHHPNIVTIFDSGRAGGFFYLLMEYVDGVNLRQAMRAGRFTPAQALGIVPKICDALQYAHDEGVLHRDIKPENILLDARGRVKLADFGIAKLAAEAETLASGAGVVADPAPPSALTQAGMALGTPRYMAPEQAADPQSVDHRADIYSLGVVFYEMLTGELPPGGAVRPSERAEVDQRVDAIVQQALERERDLRQRSAGEMKTQIEAVDGGVAPRPAGSGKRVVGRRLKRWMTGAALALTVALLLRAFVVQVFVAQGDSAAPELPAGSWVVVWKLPSRFSPGDFVVYSEDDRWLLGQVTAARATELVVRRFRKDDHVVPLKEVAGKVIAQTRGRDVRTASAPQPEAAPKPMAEWIRGRWAFDGEYCAAMARVAETATTEESRRVAQEALDQIKQALVRDSDGMRWTITASEMQSHHGPGGTRSGPYEIVEARGVDAVVVRSLDEGQTKLMLLIREGDRMRISEASPPAPHPLHIEVPAYYRRVVRIPEPEGKNE